jgi:hypothetical protein
MNLGWVQKHYKTKHLNHSKHELLEQFKVSINISSSPVSEIQIVTENSSISDNDYKDLVKFLSGSQN